MESLQSLLRAAYDGVVQTLFGKWSTENKPVDTSVKGSTNAGQEEKPSLYERLGGKESIMAVVQIFYDKCYADERIAHWFKGIKPEAQAKKLAGFACYAFGGKEAYTGKNLVEAHAHLVKRGLCDKDFDVVVELFVKALKEAKVPDDLIAEVGTVVGGTRDLVLGRAQSKPAA